MCDPKLHNHVGMMLRRFAKIWPERWLINFKHVFPRFTSNGLGVSPTHYGHQWLSRPDRKLISNSSEDGRHNRVVCISTGARFNVINVNRLSCIHGYQSFPT